MKKETFEKYVKFIDELKKGKPHLELRGVASGFISWLVKNNFIERKPGGSYVWRKNKTQIDSNDIVTSYVNIYFGGIITNEIFTNEAMSLPPKTIDITERVAIWLLKKNEEKTSYKYTITRTETTTKTTVIYE